ncbi:hypothetical protein LMG9585_19295, partial [Xanthomonas oryzae pv. oryzae]
MDVKKRFSEEQIIGVLREVGLFVLRGQAAPGVRAAVGQLPAPRRRQRALPGVVGEHALGDLHHA